MLLLVFAVVLVVSVLVSARAHRTVLSTAVLFLVAGFLAGGPLGLIDVTPGNQVVGILSRLALFAVLFTDGMRVGWSDLRSAWRLPGRALGWGLPLTLMVTALLGHFLAGLNWIDALLIGAVLAPTDPVFAAALVGNERVPNRLRHLLNVESGLNDGLALPLVIVFLALSAGSTELHPGQLAWELALGIIVGIGLPSIEILLERTRFFGTSPSYEPLDALAIGIAVLAVCEMTQANLFLAAFAAGVTVATLGPLQREAFEHLGAAIAELLKLAALLVFGALISVSFLAAISWQGWLLALGALVLARPVALWISFLGSRLPARQQVAAMWFGPKGFASVVYGLLVLNSGVATSSKIFHLVAATVTLSIILHSSTDILVARGFESVTLQPRAD